MKLVPYNLVETVVMSNAPAAVFYSWLVHSAPGCRKSQRGFSFQGKVYAGAKGGGACEQAQAAPWRSGGLELRTYKHTRTLDWGVLRGAIIYTD